MKFEELMSCHPGNLTVFEELVEAMKNKVVSPFIGAGVSASLNLYPTWTGLIKELAEEYGLMKEISKLLQCEEFESAASLLEEEIVRNEFLVELHRIFNPSKLKEMVLPEYVKIIPRIWNGNIITTNFDRVVETAFQQEQMSIDSIVPHSVREFDRTKIANQQNLRLLIKLHGDIEDYNHLVLTENEYDNVYGVKNDSVDLTLPMPDILQSILKTRMMLFLGCGLAKDRTLQVIKNCSNTNSRHFALVELPEETVNKENPYAPRLRNEDGSLLIEFNKKRKHLAKHGISCIWYPNGKHKALEALLLELGSRFASDDIRSKYNSKPILSEEWFRKQNAMQIKNLGSRYLPEVNTPLEIQNIFHSIWRDSEFKKRFISMADEVLKRYSEIHDGDKYKELSTLISNLDFNSLNMFDINPIVQFLHRCGFLDRIFELNSRYRHEYNYSSMHNELNKFKEYLLSAELEAATNPFVLLVGDGGVGKTHLIADTVSEMNGRGQKAILLLGQQFSASQSPFNNILDLLNLKCSIEEFLDCLNELGEKQKSRVIIFIDALNEGEGKQIWHKHLAGMLELLKQYPWIGLVCSIRTQYVNSLFTENDDLKREMVQVIHYGFSSVEEAAVRKYFDYFNIIAPTIPLTNSEFSNPLFVRLFCEVYQNTAISSDIITLTHLFSKYIKSKNKKIAARCNYNPSIKVVDDVINAIVQYKYDFSKSNYIKIEKVIEIVIEVEKKYNIKSDLLSELIWEGVLTQSIDSKGQEYLYITYERLEDYFYSQKLALELRQIGIDDFSKKYADLLSYGDILNSLSIVIPEKYDYELAHVFRGNWVDNSIIEGFIDSLIWREASTISERSFEYITEVILKQEDYWARFFNVLMKLSVVRRHPLNSDKIFPFILSFPKQKRAEIFIGLFDKVLNHQHSAIEKILNWCLVKREYNVLNAESVRLAAQIVACFLITSNKNLLDKSIKALVNLLTGNVDILIGILEEFKKVDDSIIIERLYAAAFGCAVGELNNIKLRQLAIYVYKNISDKGSLYARNLIEYADYRLEDLDIDKRKVITDLSFEHNMQIDPTVGIINAAAKSREKHKSLYTFPDVDNNQWSAAAFDDIPEINKFLGFDFDNRRFLLLSGLYNWIEEKKFALANGKREKKMCFKVRSYILKNDDFINICENLKGHDLRDHWILKGKSDSTLFSKENYWSERYRNHYIENEWTEFDFWNPESRLNVHYKVMSPTIYHNRENVTKTEWDTDNSTWFKPCGAIFNGLKLRYGKYNTVLYNESGQIVCFDTLDLLDEKIGFIIDENSLHKYLEQNDYKIFWIITSEKSLVLNWREENQEEYYKRPRITGVYYFDDKGKLAGEYTRFGGNGKPAL